MSYRIADMVNGPFGDTYATFAEAEAARMEYVEDGFEMDMTAADDADPKEIMASLRGFFRIVDAATGEEVSE